MPDHRDSGLRGVLGGLLALLLVGGTVVASAVIAFAEMGASRPAAPSGAAAATLPPATLLPTQAPLSLTATLPAPTASPRPSASATQVATDTAPPPASPTSLPPSETATVEPSLTASPRPTLQATECVPAPPAGWTVYVIQLGDTFSNLALKFGVSQGALQRANCVANPSDIRAGGRIYVPAVSTPPPTTAAPASTPTVPSDIPTITSIPIPSATPACVPPEFFDPLLNRCRLPDS